MEKLNEVGCKHGIGRLDLVEGRFVGMKSRGIYETPGGTILLEAHKGIESITLDRGAAHLKDELMPKYAELIYNGFWYSPERVLLQKTIDESQKTVTGTAQILEIFKVSGAGKVAGSKVMEGEITTASDVRIIRDGTIIYTGKVGTLFREKNQVKQVSNGQECGITVKDYMDFQKNDTIEAFSVISTERMI